MSITLNFSAQGQSIQFTEKELIDLQNAVTFALNGSGVSNKKFGNIRVETNGGLTAFSGSGNQKQNIQRIETDC